MLVQLLDKLADPKFRQRVEAAYFKLLNVPQFDFNYLVGFLCRTSSFLSKKVAISNKHVVPRLQMVNRILEEFQKHESAKKTSQTSFPFHAVFEKVKESIDAPASDMRKASQQIVVTCYKKFGFKKVEPLVSAFDQKILEPLQKDIPEAETYIKMKKQQPGKA